MDKQGLLDDIFGGRPCHKSINTENYLENLEHALFHVLTERELFVITLYYSSFNYTQIANLLHKKPQKGFYNNRFPKNKKYIGISKERVRQIISKSLRKLRHPATKLLLGGKTISDIEKIRLEQKKQATGAPSRFYLESYDMSNRLANCLKNNDIFTVWDLASKTADDLLKIKNFGRKCLREVKDLLENFKLELGIR